MINIEPAQGADRRGSLKPLGVISRINIPEIYNPADYQTELFNELESPTDVIDPENDTGSDDIYEEDYDATFNDTDLVIGVDSPEFQLECTEILEDVGLIESDDGFDFM